MFDLRPGSSLRNTLREYFSDKDAQAGIQRARREFPETVHQAATSRPRAEELDMALDEDEDLFDIVFAKELARRKRAGTAPEGV